MHLDELINTTLRGRNYTEYNRDAGKPVSDSRMRDLAKAEAKWSEFIEPKTLLGISIAGGVTYDEVVRAASRSIARWHGDPRLAMRQEESRYLSLMPAGTSHLTETQADNLLRLTREYIALNAALADAHAALEAALSGTNGPGPAQPAKRTTRKRT